MGSEGFACLDRPGGNSFGRASWEGHWERNRASAPIIDHLFFDDVSFHGAEYAEEGLLAGIFAGAAAGLAYLVDKLALEGGKPRGIGGDTGKEGGDALVCGDASDEFVDDRGNGGFTAESAVE
jgi:hypothetical protein